MDEQLAAIYGTNQAAEPEDQEKLAAAELLVKLAGEEGVDLDQFSDDEIAEMVQNLYGEQAAPQDDSQEKLAEADYLGRVMAHAYVQERDNIEKTANKVGDAARAVGRFFKGRGRALKEGGGEFKRVFTGKGRLGTGEMSKKDRLKTLLYAAKKGAPEAGVLGGGTVGAVALHKYRKSHR